MNEADLQPGDIILSFGKSELSRAIKEISGGRFSHAALWTGERVLESTLPQIQEINLPDLATKTHYMHVFRHHQPRGRGAVVVACAKPYVGRKYNVPELVVASTLGTLTAWLHNKNEWLEYNVQFKAERALSLMNSLARLYGASTTGSVTCVELVARAYVQAELPIEVKLEPGGHVDFDVLWNGVKDMMARRHARPLTNALESTSGLELGGQLDELEAHVRWAAEVSRRIREAGGSPEARAQAAARETPLSVLKALVLRVSDRWDEANTWYAGLVTPAQLENSLSLVDEGKL